MYNVNNVHILFLPQTPTEMISSLSQLGLKEY